MRAGIGNLVLVRDLNNMKRRPHLTPTQQRNLVILFRAGTPYKDLMRRYKLKSFNSIYRLNALYDNELNRIDSLDKNIKSSKE